MRPVGSGDSKFPSGLHNQFGSKREAGTGGHPKNEEPLFERDAQEGKMIIPIARKAHQRHQVEASPQKDSATPNLQFYFKNQVKDNTKSHKVVEESVPTRDEAVIFRSTPETKLFLDEEAAVDTSQMPVMNIDPIWSQESEGIERIPGENPDGKNTISFSSQTGELLFWSTKGFGRVNLPQMVTRKAVCTKFFPLSKYTATPAPAVVVQVEDKQESEVSVEDSIQSSDEDRPQSKKNPSSKKQPSAPKKSQREVRVEKQAEDNKLTSTTHVGLGKRSLRHISPSGGRLSSSVIIAPEPDTDRVPADMNLFKQIVKLKSTMKAQDHLDLSSKFSKLKGLLTKDFSLSSSELVEVFRVENARASVVKIKDFRHAENLHWRLAAILTNIDTVWLMYVTERLAPAAVFGDTSGSVLTFPVRDEGMVWLPDLSPRETAVAMDLGFVSNNKIPVLLISTSVGRVICYQISEEIKPALESSSSSRSVPNFKVSVVSQSRISVPVTRFLKVGDTEWLSVVGENKLCIWSLQLESDTSPQLRMTETGLITLPEEISSLSGLVYDSNSFSCFFWQFGSLYSFMLKDFLPKEGSQGDARLHEQRPKIRCLLEQYKLIKEVRVVHRHQEIDQSKYEKLSKTSLMSREKLTTDNKLSCIWVFFEDSTLIVLENKGPTSRAHSVPEFTTSKVFKLPGVHLCGAAFSPSFCSLIVLSQPALFEEGSEFRIFSLNANCELEGPNDLLASDHVGSRANSLSAMNFSHTDVVELLGTIMKIFEDRK